VRRDVTRRACAELGLVPHEDPHNSNPAFTRVRVRTEVLPLLEDALGGGVAAALARTAEQLREDGEVLDDLAERTVASARDGEDLLIEHLVHVPVAVRRRALRLWLLDLGAKTLTDKQLRAVDDLVDRWRGQGGVALGGGRVGVRLVASRRRGRLSAGFVND
jgi:tRNA(Ile)-lysidine synthase